MVQALRAREGQSVKIDIGGGTLCPPDYINFDPVHGSGPWRRRAQDGEWPTPADSVETVRASHVLEHIPAGSERLFVLNEAYRVLQPCGFFEIIVPVLRTRDGVVSWEAIADPTHVSYWCHESFLYFVRDTAYQAHADYGIQHWELGEYREDGSIAYCRLVKP
jgi:predicted SAM-dependent methyltransferase